MVIVKKFCVHTRSRADPAIEIVTNKRAERQDLRTSIELKRAEEDVKRAERQDPRTSIEISPLRRVLVPFP